MSDPPAATNRIRIGISSWSGLPGFYPPGVKSDEKLAWYARYFSLVEINVSYYRIIRPETYDKWAEKTPPNFTFDVKAFSELTHFREPPPDETFTAFRNSYAPLRDMKRLGGVLFQFPPRFGNTHANREYLRRVAREIGDDVAIIEFRNLTWLAPDSAGDTFSLLEDVGLAYVVVDEPQIPHDTVPPIPAVTNPDLAYVRLHGRNAAAWYRGGSGGTRYDYDYSGAELQEWADIVVNLTRQAHEVHVLFNNNAKGAGTRNALELGQLLGISDQTPPPLPSEQRRLFGDDEKAAER